VGIFTWLQKFFVCGYGIPDRLKSGKKNFFISAYLVWNEEKSFPEGKIPTAP